MCELQHTQPCGDGPLPNGRRVHAAVALLEGADALVKEGRREAIAGPVPCLLRQSDVDEL